MLFAEECLDLQGATLSIVMNKSFNEIESRRSDNDPHTPTTSQTPFGSNYNYTDMFDSEEQQSKNVVINLRTSNDI